MKLRKNRGQKLPPGKFAAIPVDVLKHALGLMSAPELRVWICLCAQSQPWSNGTANLTLSVRREYHLGSARTVTAAIRKMIEHGLVMRTRQSRQQVCALYGVMHLPFNFDAMAKYGASVTTAETLNGESSDSHSGNAAALPHRKRSGYHSGNAEPPKGDSALPHRKRNPLISTNPALPHRNTSKNLPPSTEATGDSEGGLQ